jgi:hypothetical protein
MDKLGYIYVQTISSWIPTFFDHLLFTFNSITSYMMGIFHKRTVILRPTHDHKYDRFNSI